MTFTLETIPLPERDLLPPHRCGGLYDGPAATAHRDLCAKSQRYIDMPGNPPPIVVARINGKIKYYDGSHRIQAARRKGLGSVLAAVTPTVADALELLGEMKSAGGPRQFFEQHGWAG